MQLPQCARAKSRARNPTQPTAEKRLQSLLRALARLRMQGHRHRNSRGVLRQLANQITEVAPGSAAAAPWTLATDGGASQGRHCHSIILNLVHICH